MWLRALLLVTPMFLAVYAAGAFPWATCAAAIALSAACLWMSLRAARGLERSGVPGTLTTTQAMCGLILLTLLASSVPLPLSLTRITGHTRHEQNVRASQALDEAAALDLVRPQPRAYALTRNRVGTFRVTALILAAFSAGWLAALSNAAHRMHVLRGLLAIGVWIAVGALISLLLYPQGDTIWWLFRIGHVLPGPVACFINRNHLGGYLAILCPAGLALAVSALERRRLLDGLIMLAAVGILIVAALLTLSRGAALATAVAVLATGIALLLHGRRLAGLTLFTAVLLILVSAPRLPIPGIRERFDSLHSADPGNSLRTRAAAWRDSFEIWRTYPIMGAGADAFRMVHPQHRRTTRGSRMAFPENEYVQLLTDAGFLGLILTIALCATLKPRLRLLQRSPPHDAFVIPVAAGAGLTAAAVHAVIDFSPHVPLYAVTLATLVGMTVHIPPDIPRGLRPPAAARRLSILVTGFAFLMSIALTFFHREMRMYDSKSYIARLRPDRLALALRWAPTSSTIWYAMGRAACFLDTIEGGEFGEACITQSVTYDPQNYRFWRELGHLRLSLGDKAGAREAFKRTQALRSWVKVPEIPEDTE